MSERLYRELLAQAQRRIHLPERLFAGERGPRLVARAARWLREHELLREAWMELVGFELASRMTFGRVLGGVLTVYVTDTAHAFELRRRHRKLTDALRRRAPSLRKLNIIVRDAEEKIDREMYDHPPRKHSDRARNQGDE